MMKKRLLAILLGLVLLFTSIPFGAADDEPDALPTDGDILSDETEEIDLPDAETPDEEPYADEPVSDEPYEEPYADEPISDEPDEEPYADEPVSDEPDAFLPPAVSDEPEGAIDIPETPSDASGSCGDNLTWTFTESTGTLTISGSGSMTNFDSTNQPWASFRSQIQTVVIGDAVTWIGRYAFYYCTALQHVTIGSRVDSIGSDSFYCCSALQEITIPASITSIGNRAFFGCTSLESVVIEEGCSATLTGSGSGMPCNIFCDCTSLTEFTIPYSIAYVGGDAFRGCTSLERFIVGDGNYRFKTVDGILFSRDGKTLYAYPCGKTDTSFTVPQDCTRLGLCAFSGNQTLQTVSMDSVTWLGGSVFERCAELREITLNKSITSLSGDFYFCSKLETAVFPGVTKCSGAFTQCNTLKNITMNANCMVSSESFTGCTALESIRLVSDTAVIADQTTSGSYTCYYLPWRASGSNQLSVVIDDNITQLGDYMFYGCSKINSITMPCGMTYKANTFTNCNAVKTVHLTKGNGVVSLGSLFQSSVRTIFLDEGICEIAEYGLANYQIYEIVIASSVITIRANAFSGCSYLNSVTIPANTSVNNSAFPQITSIATLHLTAGSGYVGNSIGLAFNASKDHISTLILDEGITTIGNSAFSDFTALTRIDFPSTLTKIGDKSFSGCTGLGTLIIPESSVSFGNHSFEGCTGLTEITMPYSISAYDAPFYGCTGVKTLHITPRTETSSSGFEYLFDASSNRVETVILDEGITQIGIGDFENYTYLKYITFPQSLNSIRYEAFYNCSNLTELVLPESVQTLADLAFAYCTNLTSVTLPCSLKPESEADPFVRCAKIKTLHLTSGTGLMTASIGSMFHDSSAKIETVTLDEGIRCISSTAFQNFTAISEVTIPDSTSQIYSGAFSGCTSLINISFPQQLYSIGSNAFSGCTSLAEVSLPLLLRSIDSNAFSGCSSLSDVYYSGTEKLRRNNLSISSGNEPLLNATWHYWEAQSIEMGSLPNTITYHIDDVFDPTGGVVYIYYQPNYYETAPLTAEMVTGFDSSRIGTCTLTVTCLGCTTTFDVMIEKSLLSISLTTLPTKTEYVVDQDALDVSGGVLTLYYDDDTTETIDLTADMVSGFDNRTVGEKALTVSYRGKTTSFTITVIPKAIEDAAVEWSAEDVQFKGATAYVIANGSAQTPRFTVINKTDGSTVDPAYYDYEYKENTNAGTGYVFVTFKNGLSGTCRGSFKIYLPATTATAVENTADGIKVTWEPVEGAAGYVIYRRAWSSTTNGWTTFARWDNTTATIYTDGADANHKVYAGTRYQYGVKAYFTRRTDPVSGAAIGGNINNDSGNFNLGLVGPLKTTVRITTRTATSATLGTEKVTVKWQPSSLFTGYQIQSATNIQFTQNAQLVTVGSPSATQRVVTGLKSNSYTGTSYYFRVRSYQKFEGMTYYGGWSNIVTARSMPKYRALLIGQNTYASSPLYGCVNDAQSMMGMLFGLKNKYVTMAYSNAYAAAIIADIRGLAKDTTKDSVSLFYYSGHGMSSNDNNVLGGLVGVDNTYIPLSMLANELNKVNGRVIVILDSCHSGATIDKSLNGENVLDAFNNEVIDAFAGYDLETGVRSKDAKLGEFKKSKFIVITAASKTQTSLDGYFDGSGYRQGAFTAAIIKGMACKYPSGVRISYTSTAMPADSNGDRNVTLKELFSYAYRTAHHWAGGDANAQRAQYYGPDAEVLFSR